MLLVQIFLLGQQAEGRSRASTDSWREDQQWAQMLESGWDLAKVKQVNQAFRLVLLDMHGHYQSCFS